MVDTLSEKQRQIVKLKAQGKNNREIGDVVYPNATIESKRELVHRELKKPQVAKYYEQEKLVALKNAGITWTWITKIIKEAGTAVTKDGEPAHATRLSAARQARELLEVNDNISSNAIGELAAKADVAEAEFKRISGNADEAEISRVLFRKSDK